VDVVLLDFDGTITRRDTTRVLVFALLRARPWRVFSVLGPLFRLAVGGDEGQIQRAKDRAVGALLRGLSAEQVLPSLLRYRKDVLPLIRPELAALMRERAAAGQQVLVVTASAEHAVKEALRDFPVTVLGTRFEAREGRFTGAVEGEGCYGAAKVPRTRAWANAQPAEPRFVEAWSDALSDLPMLELAEKRVWVCREAQVERIRKQDPQGEIVRVG
jgi:HAD superfamily phosphoserine phosphatase-like hydrolase